MMTSKQMPFWFFVSAIFILVIVPTLIQDGMFMDGISYVCVSKNLAKGIGEFWNPIFTETWERQGNSAFLEHPPLIYGIQALFFYFFGESIYVERFYSFLTACITAYLIHKLWTLLTIERLELQKVSWLPIFLWIIIPICFWSYQNNIHENTMGVFCLLSVYFSVKALFLKQKVKFYLVISGIFVFLASFSKGIPGFFPIAVIGLFGIITKSISFRRIFFYSIIIITPPILIYSLLSLNAEAYQSLSFYVKHRLLYRVESAPIVSSRFFILQRLFEELIPVFITVIIFLVVYKYKNIKYRYGKNNIQACILCISIGVSASFPLMMTLVQRGFYFLPSLPYFALGFSFLIAPGLVELIKKIDITNKKFRVFKFITTFLFFTSILISILQIGKSSRDHDMLHDIYLIGAEIPSNRIISAEESLIHEWSLHCYFNRHFEISLISIESPKINKNTLEYFLMKKSTKKSLIENYERLNLATKQYDLYKRK